MGHVGTGAGRLCQVGDDGDAGSLRLVVASHGGCSSGHLAPGAERGITSDAVFGGTQAMTVELEMVVDAAVVGEEALCMSRRLEPLHLSFSSSGRLV
jgi:hypothetical protein